MEEETVYTYILIKASDKTYLGWSKAPAEKKAGTGMKWVKWNKPLPHDIDEKSYILKGSKLLGGN